MLRHEAGDEVIDFALPACDRHAHIVGEYKANVKQNGNYPLTVGRHPADTFPAEQTSFRARIPSWKDYYRPVRVTDNVLSNIGFIYKTAIRDESGPKGDAHATGFFVSVPSKVRGRYLYFATAKHVAEDLRDSDVHILVNKKGGGKTEVVAADPPTWYTHPTDKTCDVAIVPVVPNFEAHFTSVPIEHMLTATAIEALEIGIGDEVYSVGLFTEVENTSKNIPILRHGNIAMMPTEQIQTELGFADVYLIEARSIGGMSGSPVFVRPTAHIATTEMLPDGQFESVIGLRDRTKLLGIIHGHWDVKEVDINLYSVTHDRKRGVNYGIAIVVPAVKLIETLDRPDLKESRMKNDEKLKRRGVPGMDSAKGTNQQNPETVFTKDDFEAALKKASRKVTKQK